MIPAFKVHNKHGELQAYFDALLAENQERVFEEVGRLGILAKYRGGYHGNQILGRLFEEGAALLIADNITDVMICCNPAQHRFFYKPMNFVPVPGVKVEEYYKLNAPSMAYHLDVKHMLDADTPIAEDRKARIAMFVEKAMQIRKEPDRYASCMCNNFDTCVSEGGYLEPINEPVEYHCPVRVQRFFQRVTKK